ncbi:hypothetical protein BDV37DRAFT_275735 [Aspergillus pseudonomiae]|uniref:Uncharacterized protein n=1 Tax=Aspergillus pseudonomiae TaxID=1506151 RepID=A0A5N7CZ93_9EURO|nr:uncharacterized protein BDV37DRAFT_275735 [Aspergillus pseudonomiae]KAE8398878.1 hypothetical protein BDV37DRAFT_275735 [Aspergillus pseudonomiae]
MTTKTTGNPCGFAEEDFVMEKYKNYPSSFCDLQNENLFPSSKFPRFCERDTPAARNAYTLIQPALLLISRIIVQHWESFGIFVRHRHPSFPDIWHETDAKLELSKDEILRCIKNAIPDIDFDPAIHPSSSPFAETTLRPNTMSDLITLDYNIIRLLKDSTSTHSHKLAAHVLKFRSSRAGPLCSNNEPFETPPGITCREAGTAWETRDELIHERRDLVIKSKDESDVRVELGSPRKRHRSIIPVNICGGKKVQMDIQERA